VLYAFDASRSIDAEVRRQIALPIAAIAAKRRRPFARTDFERPPKMTDCGKPSGSVTRAENAGDVS
jgi:hypothetical protein